MAIESMRFSRPRVSFSIAKRVLRRPSRCRRWLVRPAFEDGLALGRAGRWTVAMTMVASFVSAGVAVSQTAPSVASVSFTNDPTSGDTYGLAARIDVRVDFDRDVQVAYTGSPQLALEIGASTRLARYWYYSGRSVYFVHIVVAEDFDSDGIGIPANGLRLDGASITLATDSAVRADVSHDAVADDSTRKVDGTIVSAPRVDGVFFPDDQPPRDGETYGPGEEIAASVSFDKAVSVTGMPQLVIQVGSQSRENHALAPRTTPWQPWDEDHVLLHGPARGRR